MNALEVNNIDKVFDIINVSNMLIETIDDTITPVETIDDFYGLCSCGKFRAFYIEV